MMLVLLAQQVILVVMVMIAVAFFSLMERKVLSLIHFRLGPNKVSVAGILQPIADALKLVTKDDFPVSFSNFLMFYASPLLMLIITLSTWLVFPFFTGTSHGLSMLVLMILLGLTVYGLLVSGWSSNSKYALIGSMRSVSQSLSYEVIYSFLLLTVMAAMASYSLNSFLDMKYTMISVMAPFVLLLFVIASLAELNRTPFDLSEGESELVSGYSVEYGGVMYTLLFLSENVSIFVTAFMISFFFFYKTYYLIPLMWVSWALVICIIRGVLPRLRYDVLMSLCWLVLLPVTLMGFVVTVILISL